MMFDLFQSKIIAHLPPAAAGFVPDEMAKLKHWRGFQRLFGLQQPPMLEFACGNFY